MIFLIATDPPQIDKAPKYAKAASDKGGTATLLCKADGAPIVTFTWSKVSSKQIFFYIHLPIFIWKLQKNLHLTCLKQTSAYFVGYNNEL